MKKHIAAYWVFLVSFVFVMNSVLFEANAQGLNRVLSLETIAPQLTTPEAIARYLWRNFRFESDQSQFGREEHWQSPEEFLNNGKGDCEDFALFAQKILKMNGIKSFMLNIYSPRFAHTVCVFMENGKYNIIDGSKVIRFEASSLNGLLEKIYPFWQQGAIVAPSPSPNHGMVLARIDRATQTQRHLATSV